MKILFSDLLNKLCKPNPTVTKDELDFEMTFKRNKNLLLFHSICLFMIITYSALSNRTISPAQRMGFVLNAIILPVFLCTCRSYPVFFNTFYFILLAIAGPIMLSYNKDSVLFNFCALYLVPTFTLYLIGIRTFIIQVVIQVLLLQFSYKAKLLEVLNVMTPEEYVQRIAKMTSFNLVVNSMLILVMQIALVKAYHHIAIEKSQKADLERQKVFLLGFSHEMRNLINAMIGAAQLSLLEKLPSKVQELLHNSEVCGELLLHLVNNILDTGKVEIGELEINPTPNLVYDTLEKVWSICSQLIKTKKLNGVVRIQKTLPAMLKIDNYRLMQIMMNLIGNSIKFTDSGNIHIDVQWIGTSDYVKDSCFQPVPFDDENEGLFEKEQGFSVLRGQVISLDFDHKKIRKENFSSQQNSSKKGVIKIIVSDSGCGIPKEKIPLLFTKFSQVNSDPSKRKMGTGLGLFITKELIRKMQGDIRVYSKVNKGTVFIACIPVEIVEHNRTQNIDMTTFKNLMETRNVRALVVDDIEGNRDLIAGYLSRFGIHSIEFAKDGEEAFQKYKDKAISGRSFDIVTMDVNMPIIDGKKASQLIRAYEREKDLAACLLVMISGNCSESEIDECMAHPTKANFFLKKPIAIHDLFNAIKTIQR